MVIGLGRLGLTPAAFWAMTPREFAAVLKALAPDPDGRMQRRALDDMMRRFPDRRTTHG